MSARPLKRLALGLAAVVAVGSLASAVPAAEKTPIKIGLITPKTGNFAQMGIDMADGFKLYLSEIDYQVAGRKIELVEEDEGAQPAQAVAKVRKLVTPEHGARRVPVRLPVLEVQPGGIPQAADLQPGQSALQALLTCSSG